MLISVVIPTYNAERYISGTISSVLNQTYPQLELIVVDDCSNDQTPVIVAEFSARDKRVKLVELDCNFGGPAGPRNVGVSLAKGDWIAFLDADDLWHPEKLALQMEVIASLGINFCCSSVRKFADGDTVDWGGTTVPELNYVVHTFNRQCSKNRIANSSVVVARDLVVKNPFNEARSYHAVEDMQCWLQILELDEICIEIKQALVAYRINANQISRNKIIMARKFFMVLNNYRLKSGDRLGVRKYLYFITYIFLSVRGLVSGRISPD